MSRYNYDRFLGQASRLINKYGMEATLKKPTNTGTAESPTVSYSDFSVIIASFNYTKKELESTLVEASDRKLYLKASDLIVEPEVSDKILIGQILYSIIDVKPIDPGGIVLYYILQVRR